MKQTPGKIFLADQRGTTATSKSRSYHTFNFGHYYQAHKQPVGNLYLMNEEMLAGRQSTTLQVEQASHIIVIPLTGAVRVQVGTETPTPIDVEEVQVNTLPAHSTVHFQNSYEADFIQFLLIGVKADLPVETVSSQLFRFGFQDLENQLTQIIPADQEQNANLNLPFALSLGKFDGRQEVVYSLQNQKAQFFAFVISGAFEAEGRLLHEKDGLALWDTTAVELEALSHNALILVLQLAEPVAHPLQQERLGANTR